MRTLQFIFVLCFAVLLMSACSGAATPTPAPPTTAPAAPAATLVPPTGTPVPPSVTPVPPSDTPVPPTNTAAPTDTPTEAPTETPTLAPSATAVPPTATSVPPTATKLPPAATRPAPTAIPPTKPPVSLNPCNLQPGQSGILMKNTHDFEILLTIGGGDWGTHDFRFAPNSTTPIQFPPGKYTATLTVGNSRYRFADDKIDFQEGKCYSFTSP
jgi:hypothetical protein